MNERKISFRSASARSSAIASCSALCRPSANGRCILISAGTAASMSASRDCSPMVANISLMSASAGPICRCTNVSVGSGSGPVFVAFMLGFSDDDERLDARRTVMTRDHRKKIIMLRDDLPTHENPLLRGVRLSN